jgi:hypothetical protein
MDLSIPAGAAVLVLPIACGGMLLALAGCGDGGEEPDGPSAAMTATAPGRADGDAPRLTLSPRATRSAVAAGRSACRGRRPSQVVDSHLAAARRRSGGHGPELLKLVVERRGELRGTRAFPVVAARIYALSLPVAARDAAYRGCRSALSGGGRS